MLAQCDWETAKIAARGDSLRCGMGGAGRCSAVADSPVEQRLVFGPHDAARAADGGRRAVDYPGATGGGHVVGAAVGCIARGTRQAPGGGDGPALAMEHEYVRCIAGARDRIVDLARARFLRSDARERYGARA